MTTPNPNSIPRPDDPRDRFTFLDSAILTAVGIFGVSICLAYGSRAVVRWGFKKIINPVAKKKIVNQTYPNIWC